VEREGHGFHLSWSLTTSLILDGGCVGVASPQGARLSPTIRGAVSPAGRTAHTARLAGGMRHRARGSFPALHSVLQNLNQLLPASLLSQPEPGFNEIPKVLS